MSPLAGTWNELPLATEIGAPIQQRFDLSLNARKLQSSWTYNSMVPLAMQCLRGKITVPMRTFFITLEPGRPSLHRILMKEFTYAF